MKYVALVAVDVAWLTTEPTPEDVHALLLRQLAKTPLNVRGKLLTLVGIDVHAVMKVEKL